MLRDRLSQIVQDADGDWSSKRFGLAICIVLVVASWVANVFYGIVVDANILYAITGLGGVGGAGIACERFGRRGMLGDRYDL